MRMRDEHYLLISARGNKSNWSIVVRNGVGGSARDPHHSS